MVGQDTFIQLNKNWTIPVTTDILIPYMYIVTFDFLWYYHTRITGVYCTEYTRIPECVHANKKRTVMKLSVLPLTCLNLAL